MAVKKHNILAIDDDPEWLDFIRSALGEDYDLTCAACADEVVTLAREIQPSLIILDVMMQEHKDGFTAFAELQGDPDCKDIPVIIFSEVNTCTSLAFSMDDMQEYLGAQPAVFLEKPVELERLSRAVEMAIDGAAKPKEDER